MRDIDQISGDVLDTAIRLHREFGPGLLETVYETILAAQLGRMGYQVDRQVPVDIEYDGLHLRLPSASTFLSRSGPSLKSSRSIGCMPRMQNKCSPIFVSPNNL